MHSSDHRSDDLTNKMSLERKKIPVNLTNPGADSSGGRVEQSRRLQVNMDVKTFIVYHLCSLQHYFMKIILRSFLNK